MSERTCPFDRRNPPSRHKPCPDCGATRFDPCPVKVAADIAARDRLAAENARLREALAGVTGLFVDCPHDEKHGGGTVFYPHCGYDRAFPYPRQPDAPTCKAWQESVIATARALLASPDA